jgi:hypothetical protein
MAGVGTEQVVRGTINDFVSPIGIENVDWLALREEWVTTGISLQELAKKYKLNYFTVRSYYYRHQWAYHLSQYREEVHDSLKKIRELKAEELGARLAKVDERVVGLCEAVLDAMEENIDATIEYKDSPSGQPNAIDVKEAVQTLKSAVETIQKLHASVRLAGGGVTGKLDLNLLPELSEEEKNRIAGEFEYLRAKPKATITVSHTVVSDKSSQDS